jgi:hypothetical protein
MLRKVMTVAAAGALCAMTASAQAASTTQPGETVGVAAGAPLPPGLYFVNTLSWGDRNDVDVTVDIPLLAWSTPWQFLHGGRLQFLLATPFLDVDGDTEWYNVFGAAQLAWDLGRGWGFSYAAGGYTDAPGDLGVQSSSFNQRFALSYTADGWNLTANLIHGIQSEDDVADFVNLDLTATKKIGPWEVGLVGFGSRDLEGDDEPSQFALGPLVGYDFGRFIWQAWITRDITEEELGERETRFWTRIIMPLRKGHDEVVHDAPPPAPMPPLK